MEAIERFLKVDEFPSGYGSGYGSGSGSGYGYGYGEGSGYGLKSLNGNKIYIIDAIQTIIESVKNNVVKGFIVNTDLTLSPCFVAKGENKFAHGKTLSKAVQSLQEKLLLDTPIEQRIEKFFIEFPSKEKKYKASKLYDWHFYLTGSCKFGRDSFVKDKGIDLVQDSFTVNEFIDIVKDSYGSEVIQELKKQLETNKTK